MNPWKRLGLQIHLAQDKYEQKFVNSLATYSSSWLRIKFDNNEVQTDDQFQGKTGCLLLTTEILLRNDRFWRLDWKNIFKSRPKTRISNKFSRIILARIGSRFSFILNLSYRKITKVCWVSITMSHKTGVATYTVNDIANVIWHLYWAILTDTDSD